MRDLRVRLRMKRAEADLTQTDVANLLGFAQVTIGEFERHEINASRLSRILPFWLRLKADTIKIYAKAKATNGHDRIKLDRPNGRGNK